MATYQELRAAFSSDTLRSKLEVAVIVKAHAILQETSPPAERKAWAVDALGSTPAKADLMLRYLLAANKDSAIAAIQGADDATLQIKVDEAVDRLYPAA